MNQRVIQKFLKIYFQHNPNLQYSTMHLHNQVFCFDISNSMHVPIHLIQVKGFFVWSMD